LARLLHAQRTEQHAQHWLWGYSAQSITRPIPMAHTFGSACANRIYINGCLGPVAFDCSISRAIVMGVFGKGPEAMGCRLGRIRNISASFRNKDGLSMVYDLAVRGVSD
ncbi:MAG: hypothetical protein Q7N50_16265, partial [Armatimonadota bacterium]|nr:hypothetical protein [Armatimonadota bacterium]